LVLSFSSLIFFVLVPKDPIYSNLFKKVDIIHIIIVYCLNKLSCTYLSIMENNI
jgi:hypothetical protein